LEIQQASLCLHRFL